MQEVPCRHTIEMTRFNMKDAPEEPDIEAMEEREYTKILDQNMDAVSSSIGADAFKTGKLYDEHIKKIADCLYERDYCEMGRLMYDTAEVYLRDLAEMNVREIL